MIPLLLRDVEALCPGRLVSVAGAEEITGVEIDSRRVRPGDLFVAVGAGVDHVQGAIAAGAAATLVPDDAFEAMAALGRAVRGRTRAQVVGITGSAGKTSAKDILAAICRPHRETVATEGNYNNELGVPLTLCRIERTTEVCVVEMGMRGLGQIAELCGIAQPSVGIVTNVGPAHLEAVGSIENVTRAKGELVDALPSRGTAVVPPDFPVARDDLVVVRAGEPDARVEDGRTVIAFEGREVSFSFTARHHAVNALKALHAASALGIESADRVDVEFTRWRGDEAELPGGGLLINDAYNANPLSTRASLEHVAALRPGRRLVAVLGDMAELGPDGRAYHREIGALCAALGVAVVVGVGALARGIVDGAVAGGVGETYWAATAAEALPLAAGLVRPGDVVLVKGSRSVGLEAVAEAILDAAAAARGERGAA